MLELYEFGFPDGRQYLYTDANTAVAVDNRSDTGWQGIQVGGNLLAADMAWEAPGRVPAAGRYATVTVAVFAGVLRRVTTDASFSVAFYSSRQPATDGTSLAEFRDFGETASGEVFTAPTGAVVMGITVAAANAAVLSEARFAAYEPAVISRGAITADGASGGGNVVQVLLDREADAVRYANVAGLLPAITIFRWDGLTARTMFRGRVTAPVEMRDDRAVFEVLNLYDAALAGRHQNIGYQRLCNWKLYDADTCRASRSRFTAANSIVSSVSQTRITISSFGRVAALGSANPPSGYFTGGVATLVKNGITSRRVVARHSQTLVVLENPFLDLEDGDPITLTAGCNRSLEQCKGRFGNEDNFGGHIGIPERNPAATDFGRENVRESTTDRPPATPRRNATIRRRNEQGATPDNDNEYVGGFLTNRPDTGVR